MPATQYHVWCDLRPGASDMEFAAAARRYLDALKEAGHLTGWRLSRRKLGFAPPDLGEFHIVMDFATLADLDTAFAAVSERTDPVEGLHHAVNSRVTNFKAALYRDFPDTHRVTGAERF